MESEVIRMFESAQMQGICGVCGKEGSLMRTYFKYHIQCDCHSPSHFVCIDHHKDCVPKEPIYQKVSFRTEDLRRPEVIAVKILKEVFKNKSDGSFYADFKYNLANCIVREYSGGYDKANKAVDNFIERLINFI